MPSKNTIREFTSDNYYHIYNRGVEKRVIFLDDNDYLVFLGLLKRYLSQETTKRPDRHNTTGVYGEVQLLAYCLMPNHFHLLFYQLSEDGITRLMRRVSTGYVMYFNARYNRIGALFQGKFKASHINADAYLQHISRYIHLNPENYREWKPSSLPYYLGEKRAPSWLNLDSILGIFDNSPSVYLKFLEDYEGFREELKALKWQLANDIKDV